MATSFTQRPVPRKYVKMAQWTNKLKIAANRPNQRWIMNKPAPSLLATPKPNADKRSAASSAAKVVKMRFMRKRGFATMTTLAQVSPGQCGDSSAPAEDNCQAQ